MPASAESGLFATVFARFLAFVVGDVLGVRRAHAEASMAVAGISDPAGTARGMYLSLARGLVELLSVAFTSPLGRLNGAFPWARIESLPQGGKGAVIATAHTGSWDLVACAVASRLPLTVVTKRLSVRPLNVLWQRLRGGRGVRLVEAGFAARGASTALRRGELVAMLVDQAPERERGAARVSFLGAPAWVDLAPALCALRARAPLVVAFPRRLADGSHTVDVVGVLDPPRGPRGRRDWAVQAMTEVTRLLEVFVRQYPEQWLWMHRRWKDAPALREPDPRAARLARARP